MEGPPLGAGGEDITWPDQVAPRGRKASSTRKIKPQTSNLKAWLTGIPGPLGPPSCCGPPQAALGPTGSSEAGTTCRREMPGNSSRRHDKWL